MDFIKRLLLVWTGMVVFSIVGTVLMITGSLQRFNSNPTVISRETDFRTWNTQMPANTFCVINQTDPQKVENYVKRKWGLNKTHLKYEYYRNFVEDVANFQMENLSKFSQYANDETLLNVDMLELALQVIMGINATSTVFNRDYNYIKYHLIVSEIGICFSYASHMSEIFFVG